MPQSPSSANVRTRRSRRGSIEGVTGAQASPHGPANGPLTGVRILELATVAAGPTACQVMADFGADVVKIEHPRGGDEIRRNGDAQRGVPLWWKYTGRNKRSVGMYLGDPEVAELLLRLAERADVVVESFRPGTLEKWGLGYDRLSEANPGLILARLSGFGQDGPYAGCPAFGTLVEAMSGLANLTGQADGPPVLPPIPVADYAAGYAVAMAVLMALYHRDARGGTGQVIDVSVFEPLLAMLSLQIIKFGQLGVHDERAGSRMITTAPRNVYRTADGRWVAVSSATTRAAANVLRLVGRPDLADEDWFATGPGRFANADLIDEAIAGWVARRSREEVLRESASAGVTLAPVNSIPDLVADPHVRHREMVTELTDDDLGHVRMPNLLFRMSKTPGALRWAGPRLGSSTDDVLTGELGVDAETVTRLRRRGVVT